MKPRLTCAGLYRPPLLSCPKSHQLKQRSNSDSSRARSNVTAINRYRVISMLLTGGLALIEIFIWWRLFLSSARV
jgi:hypothetical protein